MKKAVLIARASSAKQVIEGDTLEDQIRQCSDYINKQGWKIDHVFKLVESGRTQERRFFQEVLNFCKNTQNKIDYLVFKNISRFTRGGNTAYQSIKNELAKFNVEIRDIYETIKPQINTMANYDLKYSWSTYYPSESEEAYQANRARDYVRDALTQMIGAEISYARKGYWNRTPPAGYVNQKIETRDDGKRNILIEHPSEAYFYKKMFEMRASHKYSDKEIVDYLNSQGYKTRTFFRREHKTKKVIGKGGGELMSVKYLQSRITKPIYAGYLCERWTHYQPVKAKFRGLISVEMFNEANIGKVKIIDNGESVFIKYGKELKNEQIMQRRQKHNPLYPFKGLILCPICRKPSFASASTGKLKVKYPAYHCSRGHKLWRISRDQFHESIYEFLRKIKFNNDFLRLYQEVFLSVWGEKRRGAVEESRRAEDYVASLLHDQGEILDIMKGTKSQAVRDGYEKQYEDLENKIKDARKARANKEKKEIDIKLAIKYAVYFMEHLEDLLIDESNSLKQSQLFGLLFAQPPTYQEIISGTPKLACVFDLNNQLNLSKSELVTQRVVVRNQIIPELIKYYSLFAEQISRFQYQPCYISV